MQTIRDQSLPDAIPPLVRSLALPAIVAAIGSIATASSVKTWYPTLGKPGWTPPSGLFGPVWTTLYALMGIADYVVTLEDDGERVDRARLICRIQLILNALWSILFSDGDPRSRASSRSSSCGLRSWRLRGYHAWLRCCSSRTFSGRRSPPSSTPLSGRAIARPAHRAGQPTAI